MMRLAISLGLAATTLMAITSAAFAQTVPEFNLGFRTLAERIPEVVGDPLENEHWGANGDSLQQTTKGLMVWRKADNWTAFTNGSRTWISGPEGIQERGNGERLEWEILATINSPPKPTGEWRSFTPRSPMPIRCTAVDPRWPERQILLLLSNDTVRGTVWNSGLVRSSNGGATWERLRPPASDLLCVALGPTIGETPVAFGLSKSSVYRSTDLGSSWREVLEVPPARPELDVTLPRDFGHTVPSQTPTLILSPDFARDGLALVLAYGRLHRSDDAGDTWHEVEPASGQWFHQTIFSPDFAHDRTIFVVALSRAFPGPLFDLDPPIDHERSLGVLVSKDGGNSWAQASQGLEVGGVPYRHVQLLVVSPTFARDGTLFAFGWGPRMKIQPGWGVRTALFRSADRGASWHPVHDFGQYIRPYPGVALSPRLDQDGTALMTLGYSGQSPSMARSHSLMTGDGGRSWSTMKSVPTRLTGSRVLVVDDGGQVLAFEMSAGEAGMVSVDGGLSWSGFRTGPGNFPSPGFVRDKTLFSSTGAIWVVGARAWPAPGSLPCLVPAAPGLAKLWNAEASLRDEIGCALEPERTVRVREGPSRSAVYQGGTVYWTEDDLPIWFDIGTSARLGPGHQNWKELHSKEKESWPSEESRVFEAQVQRFEEGLVLRFTKASGDRVILVVPFRIGAWREIPD